MWQHKTLETLNPQTITFHLDLLTSTINTNASWKHCSLISGGTLLFMSERLIQSELKTSNWTGSEVGGENLRVRGQEKLKYTSSGISLHRSPHTSPSTRLVYRVFILSQWIIHFAWLIDFIQNQVTPINWIKSENLPPIFIITIIIQSGGSLI